MRPLRTYLLPARFFWADDQLTYSARRFLGRLMWALAAVTVAGVGLVLFDGTNWREVLAGALLAWGVSLAVWAAGRMDKVGRRCSRSFGMTWS